jgi:hypothetical protein
MKLTSLSPKQKLLKKSIKEFHIKDALTFFEINKEKASEAIEFIYSISKKKMPKIFKVISPMAAQKLANKLRKTEKTFYAYGTYLTIYWRSFYAYYDFFVECGIIDKRFSKYHKLRDAVINSHIFSTIEFENAIIICEKPIKCSRNSNGLHCADGPAIKWRDGYEQYYINGRNINKEWFKKCLSNGFTVDDFIKEDNDEKRSAAYMILGEEKMMKLLGAELVDEAMIVHPNGESEIIGYYRTKKKLNKHLNESYAWRKITCPSTGTTYLTPTDPKLKTAMDVAKFHRPKFVPKETKYEWFSRS